MANLGLDFLFPKKAFEAMARLLDRLPAQVSQSKETDEVMRGLAEFAQERLQQGILGGRRGWPPLSEMTKEMKGHGKPLVDTGEFVEGITAWRDGKDWVAGIPEDEAELLRIGEVHEKGAHVAVTDRMRRFFAAQGFPMRKATKFVRIPARPWFAPAEKEIEKHALAEVDRLREQIARRTQREFMRKAGGEAAGIKGGGPA
ncbi:MAG TPA: hypothetical protein VMZ50_02045 [Phycisphaerae bacterium]|nr:hypothetical protein [Phycisphaerae bacterium]